MYSASDMLDDDASLFGDQRVVSRSLRRHSALGYRPPAPEAVLWSDPNTTGLAAKRWLYGRWLHKRECD